MTKLTKLGVSTFFMGFMIYDLFCKTTLDIRHVVPLTLLSSAHAPSGQDGDESSDISRQDLVLRMSVFDGLQ